MTLLQVVDIIEKSRKPLFITLASGEIKLVISVVINTADDYSFTCAPLSAELFLTEDVENINEFVYKSINPSTSKSQFEVYYPDDIVKIGTLTAMLKNT